MNAKNTRFNGRKILVTGGAGFIGANLVRQLLNFNARIHLILKKNTNLWRLTDILGHKNISITYADLSEKSKIENAVKKIKPDYIFHLATKGAYPTQNDPDEMIKTNVLGTMNLLKSLENISYINCVVLGSSSEYGIKKNPMKEDMNIEPNNYYAATKASSTYLCQVWSKTNRKPLVILRPFSVYGPFEEKNRLVRNTILAALKNKKIKLSVGNEARDFIYIDDLINAILIPFERKKSFGEIYNVGTARQTTIFELAKKIKLLTGSSSKIQLDAYPGRTWDSKTWTANITKIKQSFSWKPNYSLDQGLKSTIEWYRKTLHE